MIIIRARLKPYPGSKANEYTSLKSGIRNLIKNNEGGTFQFVIDRASKEFGPKNINAELVGKTIPIVDKTLFAQFNEDGTIDVVTESNEEALPREHTVDQLKMVRSKSRKTDIGDRISDMNRQGANIDYIDNPIDSGIESYEDFEKKNKSFVPSWNLKHLLSPYSHGKKINKSK
jgi:hypothetical protein